MAYNYKKEYESWSDWKFTEEEKMRELGVNEEIIQKLRDYDKKMFNTERRFRQRQRVTRETYFLNAPVYDKRDVDTLTTLINEIEDEVLYELITKTDPITYTILDLKLQGYSVNEISHILDLSIFAIYKRIRKFKEKFLKQVKK